ncbi:MAG: hypothetical protein IJI46_01935 [Erysipelotrichaceae bacterium]|nr:hypothetical protein [Erysipelotrichaceae bacterium]
MKIIRKAIILALLSVLLLSGCGGAKMDITSSSSKAKIKINDAEDGTYAEISTMSVNKNKTVHIESSLNKGKLKIEFAEAIKTSGSGESDEYVGGAVLETAEVGPGDSLDLSLANGDYVVQLTCVGQSDGTVEINIQ